MLEREGDSLVIHHLGVLDGGGSGQNGVLDSLCGMCVHRDPQTKVTGLVDRGLEFLGSELE